jgi:hypothetical protein
LWISDKKKYKHFRDISIPTEFCSNWPDGFEYNDKCKYMYINKKKSLKKTKNHNIHEHVCKSETAKIVINEK